MTRHVHMTLSVGSSLCTNEEALSPSDDEADADTELPFRARAGEL